MTWNKLQERDQPLHRMVGEEDELRAPSVFPTGDVRPAREGWLIATLPSLEGEKLYLAEIAAKTDWNDPTTSITRENPTVLPLFGQVARPLRRKLAFPVTATNELTGKSEDYEAIGYSEGARRWLDERGQWRQEGVKNIRFSVK